MMCNNYFLPFTIRCGERLVRYDSPAVMGILNATVDSFYDGGRYCTEDQVVARAEQMVAEGVDIIDIGVVSTRPGAVMLTPDEEARRLSKVVDVVRRRLPEAVLSVDTCYALPARAAVEAGADIINDIGGGLFDAEMFRTVAELHTPYVLMHNPYGCADDPAGVKHIKRLSESQNQTSELDGDPTPDVILKLSESVAKLRTMGVADIIIDPGFGFSKSLNQNYSLLGRIGELRELFPDCPLLVALSRKSMIYRLLDTTPEDALTGTVALHTVALMQGAQVLRVHDVRAARQTIAVIDKLINSRQSVL
jgi:dihydropteroate synthase